MPLRAHRDVTLSAPAETVRRAAVTYFTRAIHDAAVESTRDEVRMTRRGGSQRATLTLTEVPEGTHVMVGYEIGRGSERSPWDVYDFYGGEAAGWLYGISQELDTMYASEPWPRGETEPLPAGIALPHHEVGAAVAAMAEDGEAHHGVVRETADTRCLVAFENGTEQWVPAHHVRPRKG